MSIGSSLGAWIKAVLRGVLKFLRDLVKQLLPLILIAGALYFLGPTIGGWLSGIPGMGGLATWFTNFPSMLTTWLGSAWGWIKSGWTWFASLSFGTQALVFLGAAFILAPEETADLIGEVASGVGNVALNVAKSVVSNPVVLLIVGFFVLRAVGRHSGEGSGAERRQRRRDEAGDYGGQSLEGSAIA